MIGKHQIVNLTPAGPTPLEGKVREAALGSAAHAIRGRAERDGDPSSFAQQTLWLIDKLYPDNHIYNEPNGLRLEGRLDVVALEATLNEIVRRHEVLRTTFPSEFGGLVQRIAPSLRIPLRVSDLHDIPEEQRLDETRKMVLEECQRPFDLEKGPLIRAKLWRLSEEDHVFLLVKHHIVSDGWSTAVLFEEIGALYEAFRSGKPSRLPEPPIQYADYALWQGEFVAEERLEKQLAYWKQQLSGAPGPLDLPTDRPRPPVQTFRGARQSVILPKVLLDELKLLSRREGVTLFMTLLAVFSVLLSRYSGQDDVVVGSDIAGRNRVETEKLIGMFGNALALRISLAGNPTFRQLLDRVRETAMGAYIRQDVPFEKLLEELKLKRSPSRSPLFQVMLILHNTPRTEPRFSGVLASPFLASSGISKFDLTLIAAEQADGLRLTLEYSTDLFDAATIERMLQHNQLLLEAAVENPGLHLSEFSLLTARERQQSVVEWNATQADYPRQLCLHHLFEQHAQRTPWRTAVICGSEQMRYGELHERSNQLAHYLRKRGVGPDTLVGLCVERSLDLVVAMWGILKAGGAYVPIDPDYPTERIGFLLEDTQAPILITQQRLEEILPPHGAERIRLDADGADIARESVAEVPRTAGPDNLVHVLHTSGSTGKPKGVQITHRNVVNFLSSMQSEPGFSAQDTLLAVTTLSFDIAGLELYLPLVTGGKVVIASREDIHGDQLVKLLEGSQATVLQATPVTWRMLLALGWKGSPRLKALCGGEALPGELAAQLLPRCRELWNMYGPTETTIWSSIYRVESGRTATVPIGRPIANTQIYILDGKREPVPVGLAGELYIGGAGVARGYLNRPDLTAERFLADPFQPEGRMYRTGNLAKYLPDGNIQYLGRTDQQFKVRGYRIEPGEIEAALRQHPAVQDCVVVGREDEPGDQRLVGYVVTRLGHNPASAKFRAYLKQILPDHLIPGFFVILDSLPLTSNGKIDRRALPKPEMSQAEGANGDGFHPRDDFESALLDIWKRVLGVRSCGMTDNFFELGGHSLLLVRLGTMIEKEFKKVVPLPFLFEFATIEKVAAFLRDGSATKPNFFVPFQDKGVGPAFFCVHSVVGDVMSCRHLARFLDSEQRFYGIQLPPELRTPEFVSSVEAIASRYVDELLAFEPHGPYILGGWSAGASLALEMAQQLQARGQVVDLLVAIDAAPWVAKSATSRWNPLYYWKLLRNLPHWVVDDFAAKFSRRGFFSRVNRRLFGPIRRVVATGRGQAELGKYKVNAFLGGGDYSESAKLFIGAFYQSLLRYVPKHYNGRVVLYKAKTQPLFYLMEVDRAWRKLATDLEILRMNGTHVTLIDAPRIRPLAEHLNGRLRECRNRVLFLRKNPQETKSENEHTSQSFGASVAEVAGRSATRVV